MATAEAAQPWQDDRLERRSEANDIIHFLLRRAQRRANADGASAYVLNLDAPWGFGKTYFLSNLAIDLQLRGHVVAQVNAWETDFSEEPLLAILSAVDTALKPFLESPARKRLWRTALQSGGTLALLFGKNLLKTTAERYAGDFVADAATMLAEGLPEDREVPDQFEDVLAEAATAAATEAVDKLADKAMAQLLATFRTEAKSMATFRDNLARVAMALASEGQSRRIFVLIDELDRCRPTYALKLLEALKHLFSAQGVIFIVATDLDQLSESVKAVYGSNFDGGRYLNRFFDRRYRLRDANRSSLIELWLGLNGLSDGNFFYPHQENNKPTTFIDQISQAYELSLRDIEQCIDILGTISDLWSKPTKINLAHMFPLIILYHERRTDDFSAFSGGNFKTNFKRDPSIWQIRLRNDPREIQHFHLSDLFYSMASYVSAFLHDVKFAERLSAPQAWTAQMLEQEVRDLHKGMIPLSPPYFSVLRDYPDMVKLAVKFEDSVL